MRSGGNVILLSLLTLAATFWSLRELEAVSGTTDTSSTSQSAHKQARRTSSAHHTRKHVATSHAKRTTSHHPATSKASAGNAKTGHKAKRHKVVAHRSTAYTRLAHMQMDPARVENIQQALINAGELHGTPTGRWDAATRDAMARYQTANGFGATGLPDAKSLMKLGLGPHPLPAQLDKNKTSPASPSSPVPGDAATVPSSPGVEAPASATPPAAEPPSTSPPANTDPHVQR